ncbi:hypothetical protein SASPL_114967 [Salvia splendens]|uniref:Uncharacterized protein n=1 Tax=Salvia splendens TaxID=180675 RepID=A0A8X8Y4B3_SALSN|nr:hypothetical protein SASPL_114967 [Salvia splendens]
MNPQIPPQATFFYRGKWTATMDTLLLSTVIKLRAGSSSNDDSVTDAALNEACKTFKEVVSTSGVRWDLDEKLIVADGATWKFIFRTNPLAGAYYYEAEYSRLTTMFGIQGVKKEKSREVITISDATELIVITDSPVPNAPTRGKHVSSPTDQDEVNSPFIEPLTLVRRKLFDEPSTNTDEVLPSMAGG